MQSSIETIARTREQLAQLNSERLYSVLESASDYFDSVEETRGAIGSFGILPVVATQASNAFNQYHSGLAERNKTGIDPQMREAFDIGALHMCLAVKLAAECKPGRDGRASEFPERIAYGLKLVEDVPSATENLAACCSDPSYGNPLMGGRDIVNMLVDQYEGISLIVPKIGKLTIRRMEDLREDRIDIFNGIGRMGATVTLAALDYVLCEAMVNFAVAAMDINREE